MNCIDCGTEISKRRKRCELCNKIKTLSYKGKAMRVLERMDEIVGDVELIIPKTFIRRDLFGLFDLISIKTSGKIRFINVFEAKGHGDEYSKHLKKFNENQEILNRILERENTFELWGYRGRSKRKKKLYFLVHEYYTLEVRFMDMNVSGRQYHKEYVPDKYRVYFDGTIEEKE